MGKVDFPGAQMVKNLPAVQETWVWSLGWEDALQEEMAAHSRVLAWRILQTEEPGGVLSLGLHRVGHEWSDLTCMHALEKEMATHSSILAWRIPWTEEPGGLLSIGSHRVGHNWSNLACMHALEKEMATHSSILAWRIRGMEEPVGCRLWGLTESDTTEAT